jgi:hypothetical protein
MLFAGFPEFYDAAANLLRTTPQRNATAAVLCRDMGDLLHAAEYALTHYFPIDLSAPYLQRSSLGTPYQKWAHFTNDDYASVDVCVRALLRTTYRVWHGSNEARIDHTRGAIKSAWAWFEAVHRQFRSCAISKVSPELLVGAISPDLARRVLADLTEGALDDVPMETSAVVFSSVPLQDRSVLHDFQTEGAHQLLLMNGTLANLRNWVATHFTAADLVANSPGSAADFSFGHAL